MRQLSRRPYGTLTTVFTLLVMCLALCASARAQAPTVTLRLVLDEPTLQVGGTTQLRVIASGPGATDVDGADGIDGDDITNDAATAYASSNHGVATVSPSGLITAVGPGNATVTVSNSQIEPGQNLTATVNITVEVVADTDGDGMTDDYEFANELDPNDAADASADPDGDTLTNLRESQLGTNPHNPDTDSDGTRDNIEVAQGTDPLNRLSPPPLNENCTASIQNRTVQINANGTFAIPNVPVEPGFYRVRVVCKDVDGTTKGGQTEFFPMVGLGDQNLPRIRVSGEIDPIPVSISLTSTRSVLTSVGQTAQLTAAATLPDNSTRDLSHQSDGTAYTTSNTSIATVGGDGLVTAVGRGQVIITARNEGVLASITINVSVPNDADSDGMPDEYERVNGLNPNDGSDAQEDADSDGLTSLQEFSLNTNPRAADTDGDSLTDGAEVARGTDPLRADTDGDQLLDGQEISLGTNPRSADTDGDGVNDGLELRLNLNPLTPDQTTTVQGFVVDNTNAPARDATAIIYNFFTATTDANGFFRIQNVPASLGPVMVLAQTIRGGQVFAGLSSSVPPVAGGTTDVGTFQIVLDSGTVSGLVTDLQNRPVIGAQVRVVVGADLRTAVSDATGRYRVSGLVSGLVTVTARDPGTSLRGRATGTLVANLSTTVDVRLGPTGTVNGTVYNRDGVTPAGLGVTVQLSGPTSLSTTTNALGGYQFDFVPLGGYTVEASAAGNRGRASVTLTATGQVAVSNITYLGKGTVTGIVRDGAGNAAAGVPVTLNSRSIFGGTQTATTGPDGSYTIGNVFIGQYDVSARSPVTRLGGQSSGRIDVDGQTVTTNITLTASGSLAGTVFRSGGTTPVAGATVQLSPTGLSAQTNAQGQFRFDFLPLGSYTLDANDPATGDRGQAVGTISAQDQVTNVNVVLRGQGQVIVTVRDGANNLVSGAQVTLNSQTQFGGTQTATTQPDGTATFPRVLAGNFSVSAVDPSTQLSGSASGSVAVNATTNVSVQLQRYGAIAGVVRAANGTPAAGVVVRTDGGPATRQTTSGADGSYRIDFLPTGTYAINAVDALGNVRARNIGVTIVTQGQQITSNLTLIGAGTVTGRVTNPNGSPASNINVSLTSQTVGFSAPFTTRTDASGDYSLAQVPLGPFTIVASTRIGEQDFSGQAAGQVATDGETVTVNIQLAVSLVPTTRTFYDASNYAYNLQPSGSLQDGTTSVFLGDGAANRGGLLLDIVSGGTAQRFAGQSLGSPQLGGRQIAIQQEGLAGLNVTRKVYVPRTGYFARYLEVLNNPTAAPVTVDVRVTTNFRFIRKLQGGFLFDREPRIISTSSGDAVLDINDPNARDHWLTVDDDEDLDPFTATNLPPVAHVFDGPGAAQPAGQAQYNINFGAQYGQLVEEWRSVTIQPGATVALMHFTSEQTARVGAQSSAARLVQLPPEALTGLTAAELSQIRNFAVPANGLSTVEPLPAPNGIVDGAVLAVDNTSRIPGAHVTFKSANSLFGRTYLFSADGNGAFRLASTFNDFGGSVAVPQSAFTLRATHPQTNLQSPPTPGDFQPGLVNATQNVVFTNSGILSGVVRRSEDTVASSGTVQVSGGALSAPATFGIAGDGSYFVSALSGGSYTLTASVPHPQGTALTTAVSAQAAEGQNNVVDINLPATGAVMGFVRRGTGEVVVDIPVELRTGNFLRSTRTDTSGAFQFPDVPAGSYTVSAFEQATNIAASANVAVAVNQTTRQDLSLVTGGSVAGLVTRSGAPVSGAQMTLAAVNGNFSTTTGADGRYRFDSVGLGPFTVTATDPVSGLRGRNTGTVTVSGQAVVSDFQLFATGTVTGTVFRAGGTVQVAGAQVSVFQDSFFGQLIGSTTTDAQGRYTVDFVPAGNFRVEVSDPATGDRGRATNQVNANGEIRTINVTLNGLGRVVVTVRDSANNLISGAQVRVDSQTQFGGSQTANTLADGTVTFESVLAGQFAVYATDPATNLSGSATASVAVGATANVAVQLQPAGTIGGRVFDVDGTTPVGNAPVRLLNNNFFFNVVREIRTAPDGSYSFEAVPLGIYHVDARDATNRVRARVNNLTLNTNAQVITQDLTFVGLGVVTGQVFNPDNTLAPNVSVTIQSNNPQVGGFFSTFTNAQGDYTLTGIPVGAYTATATSFAQQQPLRGETTGQVTAHQETVRADIHLLNNAISLPVNRWDANNLFFNIQHDGSIFDGTDNSFRGDFEQNQGAFLLDLIVGGTPNRFNGGTIGTTEEAGREIAVRQQNLAGLDVTRKVFIPRDGYFVRYVESITNPTAAPITLDVRVRNNFVPYNGGARVISTSSGDNVLGVADENNPDRWVVIDDNSDTDPNQFYSLPAPTFVFDGPGGAQRAGATAFATNPNYGQLNYQWNSVTIAPGETVSYMHFGVQQISRAAARASAERLAQLPPEALAGLSQSEVSQIRNFAVPADGVGTVTPLATRNGTITGRVLAGDSATALPFGTVQFKSNNILFGNTQYVSADGSGNFTFATSFGDFGNSVVIPVEGFTLAAYHPQTGLRSPDVLGTFGVGQTTATRDIVFTNTGVVRGTVRRHNGALVTSGFVQIGNFNFFSSTSLAADGTYTLSGIPPGSYTVTAYLNNQQGTAVSGAASVNVVAAQTAVVDITLQPTGTVTGIVRNATGSPAANVFVQVFGNNNNFSRQTNTDAAGRYTLFDVAAGDYTIQAYEPFTGIPTTAQLSVVQDQTTTQDLTLVGLGQVQVQVNFLDGSAAVSSAVYILEEARGSFNFRGYTDSAGRLLVSNVGAGNIIVRAYHPSFNAFRDVPSSVTAGQTQNVAVALPAMATVRVTVLRADNTPFANARIDIRHGFQSYFSYAGNADAAGVLDIPNIPEGNFVVRAYDPNTFASAGSATGTVTQADNNQTVSVTINAPRSGNVHGTIVAADGQTPVASAYVEVFDAATGNFLNWNYADAQGAYQVNNLVPESGSVRVVAHSPSDYGTFVEGTVTFANTGETVTLDLTLPASVVRGRVTYSDGTTVAPFAQVFVTYTAADDTERTHYANADANGDYRVYGVPVGPFSVMAQDNDSALSATATGAVADITVPVTVNVTLAEEGTVTGTVTNASGAVVPFAEMALTSPGLAFESYTTADAQGVYSFRHVALGPFFVQAADPDTFNLFGSATGVLTTNGETVTVNVALPGAGTVRGRVYESDGTTPAVNARVIVENFANAGPNFYSWTRVTSDSSGNYEANGVQVGEVRVTARSSANSSVVGVAHGTVTTATPATVDVSFGNAVRLGVYNLDGADGFRYDVECDGELGDGGTITRNLNDAYDGSYFLKINAQYLYCAETGTLEDGGREIAIESGLNGLLVTRKIFSPAGGGFARFLDSLTNQGATAQTLTFEIESNLGSDGSTRIVTAPSETGNTFAVTDQSGSCCDPALAHVFSGVNPSVPVASTQFKNGNDDIFTRWTITVQPGQTVTLMHFAVQRAVADTAGARSQAEALVNLTDPKALEGMSPEEKARVVNFPIPPQP
jgi:plastocyanin